MVNDLLKYAMKEVSKLNSGEPFLVKDLFKGYEWNRIPRNDRLRLGILFLNEVKSDSSIDLEILEKTTSNQQKYKKQ